MIICDILCSAGFSDSRTKPSALLTGCQQPDPASCRLSHLHGHQLPPDSSHLDAMRGGASLLESSALWDTRNRTPDLSSGSSGYQSGSSHTGDSAPPRTRVLLLTSPSGDGVFLQPVFVWFCRFCPDEGEPERDSESEGETGNLHSDQ